MTNHKRLRFIFINFSLFVISLLKLILPCPLVVCLSVLFRECPHFCCRPLFTKDGINCLLQESRVSPLPRVTVTKHGEALIRFHQPFSFLPPSSPLSSGERYTQPMNGICTESHRRVPVGSLFLVFLNSCKRLHCLEHCWTRAPQIA